MNSELITMCVTAVIIIGIIAFAASDDSRQSQALIIKCMETGGTPQIDRSRLTRCEEKAGQP